MVNLKIPNLKPEVRSIDSFRVYGKWIEICFNEGKLPNMGNNLEKYEEKGYDWSCKFEDFLHNIREKLRPEEWLLYGIKGLKICFYYCEAKTQWEMFCLVKEKPEF